MFVLVNNVFIQRKKLFLSCQDKNIVLVYLSVLLFWIAIYTNMSLHYALVLKQISVNNAKLILWGVYCPVLMHLPVYIALIFC